MTTFGNNIVVDGTIKARQATQSGEAVVLDEGMKIPREYTGADGDWTTIYDGSGTVPLPEAGRRYRMWTSYGLREFCACPRYVINTIGTGTKSVFPTFGEQENGISEFCRIDVDQSSEPMAVVKVTANPPRIDVSGGTDASSHIGELINPIRLSKLDTVFKPQPCDHRGGRERCGQRRVLVIQH